MASWRTSAPSSDQQLVVALLQRVAGDRPRRVRDRGVGLPGRQQRQRRLVQPRLGLGREPVPLHHQPGLERRAGRHVDAVQQLGQVPAAGRALGQQQVGQQRPRLAAPRRRGRLAVALDGRWTQQSDGQRHEPLSPPHRRPAGRRPQPVRLRASSIRRQRVRRRVRRVAKPA
jgi:hypothetical protein